MKLKKYKKSKRSKYDPIRIIFGNLYLKHKTKIINYNISQINSILFNYSIPDATQIIRALYKEMVILCDSNEYIKNIYSFQDSLEKLKIFGYIYTNNFRPPPNYISLDRFNSNVMFKLLSYKQELIDRYNYYKLQKELNINNENGKNYEDNVMDLKHLYDSSDNKKTNTEKILSKKSSSKNKPNIKSPKSKLKKNVVFSKDTFNLKSNISSIYDESKYESKFESKGVSKFMEPIEIKENEEENKENSIESVMKIMENFKKKIEDNNEKKILINRNFRNFHSINICKRNTEIRKAKTRSYKRGLTGQMLYNQTKIIDLIKKYRHNFIKNNKYFLPIEKFKEKMKENNKKKEYLEKYWKINKNFVTNLIENKNINIKNRILFPNFSLQFNYTSEDTITKNFTNNYYNLLSLSPISKMSTFTNSKMTSLSPKSQNNNNYFKKYKLNLNRNRNKVINSFKNKRNKNSLIMKIKNNSDFMKNKNFICINSTDTKSTSEKNLTNKATSNNKEYKKKIISFLPLNIIKKHSMNNIKLRRKYSDNISKKYDYFGNSSLQNDYDYLKSKS